MNTGMIFDMDGVLVDSGDAHRRAWQALGEEVGTPFTAELFQRTFGQRNETILPGWLGHGVGPQRIEELAQRKESLYRSLVRAGGVRIYDRVGEIFATLRAREVGIAIASSGPLANIELLIEIMGVRHALDGIVTSEDVRHGKPDPEVFLTAAQRLHLQPQHCAVVEDSVHGIEAAKRAGMTAVAVLTSTPPESLAAAGADVFAGTVADIDFDDLLGRLLSESTKRLD